VALVDAEEAVAGSLFVAQSKSDAGYRLILKYSFLF
jgi:hypothetical protein